MREDGVAYTPAITASGDERLAFIQKVYSLVFVGIAAFAAGMIAPIVGAMAGIGFFEAWLRTAFSVPFPVALIAILGTSWLVHSVSMVKGWNLVAFFAMSQLWAFLTLPLVVFALQASGLVVIVQAGVLTTVVMGGLTAYVMISKKDFSFLGAGLMVGLFLLIGLAVCTWVASYFFGMEVSVMTTAMSAFAVILFSGYVLYDTSNVLHHYATDMVVPAALALMVDFIILFRSILFLLMARRD
jgi:FtsH-binding integral membrane protein